MQESQQASQEVEEITPPEMDGDGSQVIEIGWQLLLIPLVILTVVGGYYAGRMLRGDAVETAAPSAAGDFEVVDAASGLTITSADASAPILQPSSELNGFGAPQAALPPSNHPLIGQTAPDFTMNLLSSGDPIAVGDLRGKTVMINFWATWCPPCRYEMPWLEAVYAKYGGDNFELLAVDAGEKVPADQVDARVRQFVDRMGLTFPVLMGDNTYDVQRAYGVYGLPATFILDGEGKVVAQHGGMYPSAEHLEGQLLEHLNPDS
jgi:thiol-disulfide isomerase/thioredoxin